MPARPAWYGRLDEIVAELEALPRPWVDRATLEFLLRVGPRRAQQIMAGCITERIGTSSLADREMLIEHLRALAEGDTGHYERRRRKKVAAAIESMRHEWMKEPRVLVEASATIVNQEFEDLPEGVELAPGRITVRFDEPQQALEKMLALAMAAGRDMERFEQLVRHPAGGPAQGR